MKTAWKLRGVLSIRFLGNATPVHEYEPNTWGPAEADQIIAGDGGWHNPKPIADKTLGTITNTPIHRSQADEERF